MDNAKKKKIITISCAALILCGLLVFMLTQTKTGDGPSQTTVFPTAQTTRNAPGYTVPAEYTTQPEHLSFSFPTEDTVECKESLFSFAGTCGRADVLTCNGAAVTVSERGVFSAEYTLTPGANRFVFVYGNETREFTVNYSIDVLTQVAPGGLSEVTPGTQIEILALAYKDAAVTAHVAGQAIPLTATERNAFTQSEGTKDYKTFAGIYTAPAAGQSMSLGNISVTGSYGGNSVTLTGGEIYLHADLASIVLKAAQVTQTGALGSYYDTGTHGLLTPFSDNGLGVSQLCEILKDKAETTNAADSTDNNDIFCTPFARGTFDYVTGAVSYEDELMLVLASGRKVYAKEARFISPGYVLPTNSLTASDTAAGDNTTDFYISTRWAVPTSVSVAPQQYYIGYQNRPFNVTSFTPEYLDVTFYHTSECGGSFTLPDGSLFSSMEWINNGNDSVTLRCRLARKGKFCGCSIDLTDDGRFRLSVKNVVKGARTVVIDPGHGGIDPGAQAIFPEIKEQMINIAIGTKTAAALESRGVNVTLTRTGNESHSLDERMLISRQFKPDAFVSVHSDYASNASISGTHTFYYYPWSMELAKSIHAHMITAYKNSIYPPGSAEYEHADRGVKFYPFQVTRVEECPAVLIECGFVSNVSDCSVMLTPACQDLLAGAIADGIVEYLNSLN